MPPKHPIKTAAKKKKKEPPIHFSVYHVRAGGGGDILIEVVAAPNATAARRDAGKRLPGSTILHVRKGAEMDGYPGARFIKGKFRLTEFSDDSMLMEINK